MASATIVPEFRVIDIRDPGAARTRGALPAIVVISAERAAREQGPKAWGECRDCSCSQVCSGDFAIPHRPSQFRSNRLYGARCMY